MKMRLFFSLCLIFLLLGSYVNGQNRKYGELDFVTIVKQSGDNTQINLIAPKEFEGVEVDFYINDTSGNVAFQDGGLNASATFNINLLYQILKGKSLKLHFRSNTPDLIIPRIYLDGETKIIGDDEMITHTSKLSRMGVWNCKTSVRSESDIASILSKMPEGIVGKGTVILIPVVSEQGTVTLQDYYETFLPGETTIRKVSSEKASFMESDFHGRTAQISHIMQQNDVKGLVQRNLKPGFYRWYAPNLSYTYVWAPATKIPDAKVADNLLFEYITGEIIRYDSLYHSGLSVYPVAVSSDVQARNIADMWSSVRYSLSIDGELRPLHLPKMKVMDFEASLQEMIANIDIPISLLGEYHCVDDNVLNPEFLHDLMLANIATQNLLTTEKIATVLSLLKGGFLSYPEEKLELAWKLILNGNITGNDLIRSKSISDSILTSSLKQITPLISTKGIGKPVIVFNPGTHTVSDMIAFPTNIPTHDVSAQSPGKMRPGKALKWRVFDVNGVEAPAQMMTREDEQYLLFTATEISGYGLKTFYLKAADDNQTPFPNADIITNDDLFEIDNQYYKIKLSASGISSLFDKKYHTELLKQGSTVGEIVIRKKSNNEQIFQSDPLNATWEMSANGPVMTEFAKIEKTPIGKIITTFTVFHQVKKIAFNIAMDNDINLNDDYIINSPLVANMTLPTVYYKVPLGFSKEGYASVEEDIFLTSKEERFANVKNVNGIVSINNGAIDMTVSGDFLLCDIYDLQDKYKMVSPMSVVGNNSESLFNFQISSSYVGDKQLRIDSYTYHNPLVAVGAPEKNMGMVPDQLSFFNLKNREMEILSLRKAPGKDDVVLRILETQGKKGFAILDPMFAFTGFSTCSMNMKEPLLIPSKKAARLKLKTAIDPWSTSTILMHR